MPYATFANRRDAKRGIFKLSAATFFELRPPAGRACVIHGDCLPGEFDLNAARKGTPIVLGYTSHHPQEHPPSINLPRSCEAAPHKPICDATDVPDELFDRIG
ncbi:hypothetical protein ADP8_05229 (plasmid) [Roseomonas mucosa]|nr:hypothetical protein ADP8_05229 [Roseomonas mucosa]